MTRVRNERQKYNVLINFMYPLEMMSQFSVKYQSGRGCDISFVCEEHKSAVHEERVLTSTV